VRRWTCGGVDAPLVPLPGRALLILSISDLAAPEICHEEICHEPSAACDPEE